MATENGKSLWQSGYLYMYKWASSLKLCLFLGLTYLAACSLSLRANKWFCFIVLCRLLSSSLKDLLLFLLLCLANTTNTKRYFKSSQRSFGKHHLKIASPPSAYQFFHLPYCGLKLTAHRGQVFFLKLTADQMLVFRLDHGSCLVNLLKTGQDCSGSQWMLTQDQTLTKL